MSANSSFLDLIHSQNGQDITPCFRTFSSRPIGIFFIQIKFSIFWFLLRRAFLPCIYIASIIHFYFSFLFHLTEWKNKSRFFTFLL